MRKDLNIFIRHLPFVYLGLTLIVSSFDAAPALIVETWVGDDRVGLEWTTKRD